MSKLCVSTWRSVRANGGNNSDLLVLVVFK